MIRGLVSLPLRYTVASIGCAAALVSFLACRGHDGEGSARKAGEGAAPALIARSSELNLGDVAVGTESVIDVSVMNVSGASQRILKLIASCGCTDVSVDRHDLAADETVTLSGVFRASSESGLMRRSVSLHLAGGETVELFIIANVINSLVLTPAVMTLRPDPLAITQEMRLFTLTNESADSIRLTGLKSSHPNIQVDIEDVNEISPGESIKGSVTIKQSFAQPTDAYAIVSTTHPLESTIRLPIKVEPTLFLNLEPIATRLGVVSKAELLAGREIRVRLSGPLLEKLLLTGIKMPSFLIRVNAEGAGLSEGDFVFRFQDRFSGIDLTGEIQFTFQYENASLKVVHSVGGFLADAF